MRTKLLLTLILITNSFAGQGKDNIRLNMADLRATFSAYTATVTLVASDPKLIAKLKEESERAKEQDENGNSFTTATRHLAAADSRFQAAFAKAGITPEQAGQVMETLFAIVFADGMATDKSKPLNLPATALANLTFYREHKAEIEKMIQQFQATSQKAEETLTK